MIKYKLVRNTFRNEKLNMQDIYKYTNIDFCNKITWIKNAKF